MTEKIGVANRLIEMTTRTGEATRMITNTETALLIVAIEAIGALGSKKTRPKPEALL